MAVAVSFFVFNGDKTVTNMSRIQTVVGIVLIISTSPCFSARTTQPQGQAKEPQENEQAQENTAKLNQALFSAVVKDLRDEVARLIAQGADIDTQNRAGFTPLFLAVMRGNVEMVKLLVEKGARFDVAVRDRMAAIHLAVAQGKREIVEVFVSHGADISTLHRAVFMGELDRVRNLVEQGVDINVKDELGMTPLFWAISLRQVKVAELLIAQGADVNAETKMNQTPLYIAAIRGSREVMEMLIANGAEVTSRILASAVQSKNKEIVDFLLGDKDRVGNVLLSAAENGNQGLAKQALDRGADVNISDKYGLAPLHYAAARADKEIASLLLTHGADVHVRDNAGRVPLHYVIGPRGKARSLQEISSVISLLLTEGANINVQDKLGYTPLHRAVLAIHVDIVKLLVERGADLYLTNDRGHTPYYTAKSKMSFYEKQYCSTKEYTPQELKRLQQDVLNKDSKNEYLGVQRYVRWMQFREMADLLRKDGYRYVVSTEGKDSNPGTDGRPFRTLVAAVAVAEPGDVILVRPGVYSCSQPLRFNKSGAYGKRIHVRAYSQERPVFDFSGVRGDVVEITGAYWHLKGLIFTQGQAAAVIFMIGDAAHHNILEQITAHDNPSCGIQLRGGPSYNLVLNCDSYLNHDLPTGGDGADGFVAADVVGSGNILIGNRAWNNSDDGFDFWRSNNTVRVERCYAWNNGINIWMHPFFFGDGNGFKLGGGGGLGRNIFINCVAWNHPHRGFVTSDDLRGKILLNCTGWGNLTNYSLKEAVEPGGEGITLRNNLSCRGGVGIFVEADNRPNSWDSKLDLTLTDDDFLSLDDSKMSAPRNPDGSIPQNDFLKLAPGSAAIDKGADVGMPFVGARPDLGAFEYDPNETSEGYVKMLHQSVRDHDVKEINKLLAAGEGINDKDWLGYTPLHWAVYFGYLDLIELLISTGADPNIQSDTGRYALEIAHAMAYPELEALLRKLGAK